MFLSLTMDDQMTEGERKKESCQSTTMRPVDGALDVPTGSVGARRPMPQDRFRIGAFEFEFFMACKAVEPLELRPNGLATTVMPLPRPPNFLRSLRLRCFWTAAASASCRDLGFFFFLLTGPPGG